MVTPRDTGQAIGVATPLAAVEDVRREAASAHEAEFATRWTRVEAAVVSSRGWRHDVNEDCHSTLDGPAPLYVVADGVGGGALASYASHELVRQLHATLDAAKPEPATVRAALVDADRAIERSIAARTDASGAATVALCQAKGATLSRWLVAWVGDCRVYRLPHVVDAAAELITADDSYRQLGEEPPPGGSLDDPARMVGNGAVDVPNIGRARLRPGDMLVLCSDGVHRHAAAADIARLLRGTEPLARRCVRLVDFVRDNGSSDDATVLVVQRVEQDFLRSARLVILVALVALLAGASAWLVQDSSSVRDVAPARVDSPPSRGST